METLNQNWQTVSEIELIYKTKVKSSQPTVEQYQKYL